VRNSQQEIDLLITQTAVASEDTPTPTLRQWRADLVRASLSISYAISVLSLDIEILNSSLASTSEDAVQALVNDLPDILASEWIGGELALSPDPLTPVTGSAEFEIDQATELLGFHAEMVGSDLGDHHVVGDLLARARQERLGLYGLRSQIDSRLRGIHEAVRNQYASGVASINDWLT
jgi:hypothetical protein